MTLALLRHPKHPQNPSTILSNHRINNRANFSRNCFDADIFFRGFQFTETPESQNLAFNSKLITSTTSSWTGNRRRKFCVSSKCCWTKLDWSNNWMQKCGSRIKSVTRLNQRKLLSDSNFSFLSTSRERKAKEINAKLIRTPETIGWRLESE